MSLLLPQIATRVPDVYQVSFPASVHATLSTFSFVNLELATVVPPACLGLDSFYARLLGAMLCRKHGPFGRANQLSPARLAEDGRSLGLPWA